MQPGTKKIMHDFGKIIPWKAGTLKTEEMGV
jgi:hypothetical protein